MKTWSRVLLVFVILSAGYVLVGNAHGQSAQMPREAPRSVRSSGFNCHPFPCVLPPTQASEGGSTVTDSPIVANPLNEKQLLLGSVDFNCPEPAALGFHLSRDGGSTWKRHCMPVIRGGRVYWPADEPSVSYDRNGNAYIAGVYSDSEGQGYGFLAVQKSSDQPQLEQPNNLYPD
jgi:hypothetical protein